MSEAKQSRISVYIDEDLREKFRLVCLIKNESMNGLINELINKCVEENAEAVKMLKQLQKK